MRKWLPVTIYLVLPPNKLLSHGKTMRLWLGVLMAALSRPEPPLTERLSIAMRQPALAALLRRKSH